MSHVEKLIESYKIDCDKMYNGPIGEHINPYILSGVQYCVAEKIVFERVVNNEIKYNRIFGFCLKSVELERNKGGLK